MNQKLMLIGTLFFAGVANASYELEHPREALVQEAFEAAKSEENIYGKLVRCDSCQNKERVIDGLSIPEKESLIVALFRKLVEGKTLSWKLFAESAVYATKANQEFSIFSSLLHEHKNINRMDQLTGFLNKMFDCSKNNDIAKRVVPRMETLINEIGRLKALANLVRAMGNN